jgi:thioester reductase-like protein
VNVSLLEQTECLRLVHSSEVGPVVKKLQQALPLLRCQQLPSLGELLNVPSTEYLYNLTYTEAVHEPVLILHSSGSTGMPKPVVNTHGTFATYDARGWPTVPGRVNHDLLTTLSFPSQENARIYDLFPPFHVAGFLMKLLIPIYGLSAPIFGPPLRPPSGALAGEIIRLLKPKAVAIPPSIAEQLYHEHDGIEIFKQLDVLLYAGGPLPQDVGDAISKHTKTLCQFYGSTEAGQIRQLVPLPEDWSYMVFHPNEQFELQPTEEGAFELVLLTDKGVEHTSSLYHNFPLEPEWRTKDLFKPHPTKPGLWKFHARRDDILVFSSGEKLNPIPMESSIMGVSGVGGALVVGQGHPQAALLVELGPNAAFSSDPREDLWPAVEKANNLLPGHGRIAKSMILIADATKPFARAGKGTVIRRLTEVLYSTEIQRLYDLASTTKVEKLPIAFKPSGFRTEDVAGMLRATLSQVSVDGPIEDEDNFYIYGMDSVKTIEMVGLLKASLLPYRSETDLAWISGETVYRNPTIKQLSSLFVHFLNDGSMPTKRDRVAEMKAKIAEYTRDLPQKLAALKPKTERNAFSVAVTGTTGYLGGYLLEELVKNPQVSRIYCLNRSPKAQQVFEKWSSQDSAKIEFLQVKFASSNLGLSNVDYARLTEDCDIIIHNAWKVDFNLGLSTFEDNLLSVKHLINLSAASALRPRILFISSVSATGVMAPPGSPQQIIPEDVVDDLGLTMDMGYAESKQVSEHILHAASQSGIPTTIIRVGQIAPSTNDGIWPIDDSTTVFLQTCKVLALVASDWVDTLDWVPVDSAATAVVNIMQHDFHVNENGMQCYNMVNPRAIPWSELVGAVKTWCGEAAQIVSLSDWVTRLKELEGGDPGAIARLPALKMLAVYEGLANRGPTYSYRMEKTLNASESMAKLGPIDVPLLQAWLERL